MDAFWDKYKAEKRKETRFSIIVLVAAIVLQLCFSLYLKTGFYFSDFLFFVVIILLLWARYKVIAYRIDNRFYGNNEAECREILAHFKSVGLTFDCSEGCIHWHVDVDSGRIRPVVSLSPDFLREMEEKYGENRYGYDYRYLYKDGNFGEAITSENVFPTITQAVYFLENGNVTLDEVPDFILRDQKRDDFGPTKDALKKISRTLRREDVGAIFYTSPKDELWNIVTREEFSSVDPGEIGGWTAITILDIDPNL